MANRQVAGLTARTLTLTDVIPTQDAAAAAEAGKNTVAELKAALALVKSDVGLGNVDNTSDANKPVSTAQGTAIGAKQNTLVSGTNIKTVGGQSLMGMGDIAMNARLLYCFSAVQSGSSAPTITTYLNQLYGTVVWTRIDIGTYEGTLVGAFLLNKFPKIEGFIKYGSNLGSAVLNTFTIQRLSDDAIALGTFTNGTLTDGLLRTQYFELSIFY